MPEVHTSQASSLELKNTVTLRPQHQEHAGDGMPRMAHGDESAVPGTHHDGLANHVRYLLLLGSRLHCLAASGINK
jgi:hypothetical protein